ncbi:uncharacterized protein PAC_13804 [Phialocephala subalpina]|uniref:Uncharacterized protein n=1 Tax=Phialocephala subalpina TaxID=576137 RepID=A0A1L7XG30_9HELO|nr:uncharacterized protein PAC_13804 [Phialocephala subalpina]
MDKVNKSLDDVERKMTKLNAITAKGAANITMKDVIKASRKGNSITSTYKKGAKDLSTLNPSEAELKDIIVKMDRIVARQEKQMEFTVLNKPFFDKMHVSGVVKKSMQKNEGISHDLTKILIEKCPSSLKPEAENLDKRAQKSFADGLAAYSNAKGGEDLVDDKVDDSD